MLFSKRKMSWDVLEVQWLRVHLLTLGTWLRHQSRNQHPTCHEATKATHSRAMTGESMCSRQKTEMSYHATKRHGGAIKHTAKEVNLKSTGIPSSTGARNLYVRNIQSTRYWKGHTQRSVVAKGLGKGCRNDWVELSVLHNILMVNMCHYRSVKKQNLQHKQ